MERDRQRRWLRKDGFFLSFSLTHGRFFLSLTSSNLILFSLHHLPPVPHFAFILSSFFLSCSQSSSWLQDTDPCITSDMCVCCLYNFAISMNVRVREHPPSSTGWRKKLTQSQKRRRTRMWFCWVSWLPTERERSCGSASMHRSPSFTPDDEVKTTMKEDGEEEEMHSFQILWQVSLAQSIERQEELERGKYTRQRQRDNS